MAETLLNVLLVTSSPKGTQIVFNWPPFPSSLPRLARPKPHSDNGRSNIDGFWVAATGHGRTGDEFDAAPSSLRGPLYEEPIADKLEYEWRRPSAFRHRSQSFTGTGTGASSTSRPSSRGASPSKDRSFDHTDASYLDPEDAEYNTLLGYPTELLAKTLCTQRAQCHRKFELIVDDLAFIGHPVSVGRDGMWRFGDEKRGEERSRGRGTRFGQEAGINEEASVTTGAEGNGNNGRSARSPLRVNVEKASSESSDSSSEEQPSSSSLDMFHLVLVIDLPDPSSSASGNLFKYFHVMYENIAFTVTAVLFQEQVVNQYIDKEFEALSILREKCQSRGDPFSTFVSQALDSSSLARAFKSLYEAIKSNTIAQIVINDVGIEVQLPPRLDMLLHPVEDDDDDGLYERSRSRDADHYNSYGDGAMVQGNGNPYVDMGLGLGWGAELSFAWGLPTLAPWKSLLLFDLEAENNDLVRGMSARPGMNEEDQISADRLVRFLQAVSIFDSLAVVANSLDWDLEQYVYPTVRWLVFHRRAKIVDTVHRGLKTMFALAPKLPKPLLELSTEFSVAFPQPNVPSLPALFAIISNSAASAQRQAHSPLSPRVHTQLSRTQSINQPLVAAHSEAHFFATVVKSKEFLPLYHDVVLWMLKRDLLVTLHLHIRIVATVPIKRAVCEWRESELIRKERRERERDGQRNRRRSDVSSSTRISMRERDDSRRGSTSTSRRRPSRVTVSHLDSFAVADEDAPAHFRPTELLTRDRARRFSSKSTRGDLAGMTIHEEGRARDDNADQRHVKHRDRHGLSALAAIARNNTNANSSAILSDQSATVDEDEDEDFGWDGEQSEKLEHELQLDASEISDISTIIDEPGRATALQRKWMDAMSEGKDPVVRQRFEQINQFFDGKCTDDEILHRAEISRKQLREVLHQYEPYLLTFLHPA